MLGIAGNTDPAVEPAGLGRARRDRGLVMMHFMAFFDLLLAFWRKSTGLATFGLEGHRAGPGVEKAHAPEQRDHVAPVVAPTGVLGAIALANGAWIDFNAAAIVGVTSLAGAGVVAISSLVNPTRGPARPACRCVGRATLINRA
jgi:hypothetical protein